MNTGVLRSGSSLIEQHHLISDCALCDPHHMPVVWIDRHVGRTYGDDRFVRISELVFVNLLAQSHNRSLGFFHTLFFLLNLVDPQFHMEFIAKTVVERRDLVIQLFDLQFILVAKCWFFMRLSLCGQLGFFVANTVRRSLESQSRKAVRSRKTIPHRRVAGAVELSGGERAIVRKK